METNWGRSEETGLVRSGGLHTSSLVRCLLAANWPDEQVMRPGCRQWSHPGHRQSLPVAGWMRRGVDGHLVNPAGTDRLTGPNCTEHAHLLNLTGSQTQRFRLLIAVFVLPMLQNPGTFPSCTWLVHYASQRANLRAVKSDIACVYKIFHQSNHIQTAEPKSNPADCFLGSQNIWEADQPNYQQIWAEKNKIKLGGPQLTE